MNLPTDNPCASHSVGVEDGGSSRGGVAVLDSPVEWMNFCPVCEKETRFIAQIEMLNGLYGCCSSCGDERVAPYTRTTVEAA